MKLRQNIVSYRKKSNLYIRSCSHKPLQKPENTIKYRYETNKKKYEKIEHLLPIARKPVEISKYDKELYKRRNEVERYFLRLKRFKKVFTRYDKLDVVFLAVINYN